ATPLRALIAKRSEATDGVNVPAGGGLASELERYDQLRAEQPWLNQWPMTISGAEIVHFTRDGLWLVDGEDGVPLHPRQRDDVLVLSDVAIWDITGLWDGRYFMAAMAETSLGRWIRQ